MAIRANIDLRRAVKRFAVVGGVTLERTSGGARVDGRWHDGEKTSSTIEASVQPASSKDKQVLGENLRTRDAIAVWSESELKPVSVKDGGVGDVIVYKEKRYEVVQLFDWDDNGKFWKAICVGVAQ